ncbi:phosphatidylglycerophosphatase A [Aliikangiella maris]|uniref:Phosphatidylglycerophosphatase A n=2 Tax=Aliikangiella maris TaxID=3162458 RepID=A0ABV3MTZ5_9GAMM
MIDKTLLKLALTNPIHFLSMGLGSGLAPIAPGTFGTLAVVPLYCLLAPFSWPIYLLVCLVCCLAGIFFCRYTADALGVHDHPAIVWDEFAGFLITMAGVAFSWQNIMLGFVLFRFFDIVKPWPIRWIDKQVSGGVGIMLDDIIAGIFAWISLYGLRILWP